MTRGGQTYFYMHDGLGSVRNLLDSLQAEQNRYDYEAFGLLYAAGPPIAISQPYTFTGRQYDDETDLMYFRHRMLCPRNGVFESRDALGYGAGSTALYRYAKSLPTMHVDPMGLYTLDKATCCVIDDWVAGNLEMIQRHSDAIGQGFTSFLDAKQFIGGRTVAYSGIGAVAREQRPAGINEALDYVDGIAFAPGRYAMTIVVGGFAAFAQNTLYPFTGGYYGGAEAAARDWVTSWLLSEWGGHVMAQAEFETIQRQCIEKYGPTRQYFDMWLWCCPQQLGALARRVLPGVPGTTVGLLVGWLIPGDVMRSGIQLFYPTLEGLGTSWGNQQ